MIRIEANRSTPQLGGMLVDDLQIGDKVRARCRGGEVEVEPIIPSDAHSATVAKTPTRVREKRRFCGEAQPCGVMGTSVPSSPTTPAYQVYWRSE